MTQHVPLMHVLLGTMLLALAAGAAADPASVQRGDHQWALSTSGEDLPWAQANDYCRTLEMDGHRDWRLPTLAELETLHDPAVEGGIAAPITLDTCCIWSSTTLAEMASDEGGATAGDPEQYYWGFLFEAGTRYYSFQRFADGRALCLRDRQ